MFLKHFQQDPDSTKINTMSRLCDDCKKTWPEEDFLGRRYICRHCQIKTATHPQVLLTLDDGEQFHVDEKLKDLIYCFNRYGFITLNSCQENKPNIAWIAFAWEGMQDLDRLFVRIREHDETFFHKMAGYEWKMSLDDGDFDEDGSIDLGLSLRFPAEDIPLFTAVMEEI